MSSSEKAHKYNMLYQEISCFLLRIASVGLSGRFPRVQVALDCFHTLVEAWTAGIMPRVQHAHSIQHQVFEPTIRDRNRAMKGNECQDRLQQQRI
eukprot:6479389-Amphidinium_carterae.1